jgi:hypothetical protein
MNSREFTAPYVFREYPKWVTLADGSQIIANDADEEAVLVGPQEDADSTQQRVDKVALMEQARALGLNPHANTGVAKLQEMIAAAKG